MLDADVGVGLAAERVEHPHVIVGEVRGDRELAFRPTPAPRLANPRVPVLDRAVGPVATGDSIVGDHPFERISDAGDEAEPIPALGEDLRSQEVPFAGQNLNALVLDPVEPVVQAISVEVPELDQLPATGGPGVGIGVGIVESKARGAKRVDDTGTCRFVEMQEEDHAWTIAGSAVA